MGFDAAVTTAFKAKDAGMTATLRRITQQTRKFGSVSQKSFRQASIAAKSHNSILKGILQAGVVTSGISLLTRGAISVTQEFVKFDDAIMGAAARMKDIGPDAANFNEKLAELKAVAREAGATTEFTASQAAEALDFLARAGFNSTDAMKALKPMIDLATASGEDFARVADWSSDLLGAYGLAVDDSGQRLKNLVRLNDVLVKSANSANVTIESQFETMKTAAPIAKQLGMELEQVAGFTAIMGNAGIKGTEAATALKNSFLRLTDLTPSAQAGLATMGMTMDDLVTVTKDGKKNLLPFEEILRKMAPALKNLGSADRAGALKKVFGLRAIAGTATLKDSIEQLDKFILTLDNAGGTSAKTAALMRQSLGNQLKTLQSAAFELGFRFIEAFQKDGAGGIQSMTQALRQFDIQPIVDTLKLIISLFKIFWKVISPFKSLLPFIVGGMIAYNVAMKVHLALMSGGAIANIIRFVRLMVTMNRLRGLSTTLQWALNFAMSANPIGLVIIAMTALIAVGVLLYRNWDYVKTKFMELTAVFDDPTFRMIATILSPMVAIPIRIARNWDNVLRVLKIVGSWLLKISGYGAIFNVAKKAFNLASEAMKPKEDAESKELERARAKSQNVNARLDVIFGNMPKGTSISTQNKGFTEVATGAN